MTRRVALVLVLCGAAACAAPTEPEFNRTPAVAGNETFSYWDPREPREVPDSVGLCGLTPSDDQVQCLAPVVGGR